MLTRQVRRVPKDDLKRIARVTGATVVLTLADMDGNETFDASSLGQAEEVCVCVSGSYGLQ